MTTRLLASFLLSVVAACSSAGSTRNSPIPGAPSSQGATDAGVTVPRCDDIDLTTDSENCGACGRSCHGGSCSDGTCSAFEIHTADADISSVVVYDGFVYFGYLEDTGLVRVPIRGGDTQKLDTSPLTGQNPMRTVVGADSKYVYWIIDVLQDLGQPGISSTLVQTFGRTPLAGGKAEVLPSIGPDSVYRSVLYRSGFKFFENAMWFYTATGEEGGALERYDLDSRTSAKRADLDVDFSWSWRAMAPSPAGLVFTDFSKVRIATASGIVDIPTGGQAHQAYAVAADETHVYAAMVNTREAHTLARAPLAGGTFETLTAFGQPASGDNDNKADTDVLAVDDAFVYAFASRHDGRTLHAFSKKDWKRRTLFSGSGNVPDKYIFRGGLVPVDDGLLFYSATKIVRLTTRR